MANVLSEILANYGIQPDQIYSITSDNGRNYVKAKKVLQQRESDADVTLCLPDPFEEEDIMEFAESEDQTSDTSSFTMNDSYLFDTTDMISLVKNITPTQPGFDELVHLNHESRIQIIACAAHTFNLVITSALSDNKWEQLLKSVRDIVKLYRTSKFNSFRKQRSLPRPVLDINTRWNTIYLMVSKTCLMAL